MNMHETYLGDAVYASFDGYMIKLWTGDITHQVIYLDPHVFNALLRYAKCFCPAPFNLEIKSGEMATTAEENI